MRNAISCGPHREGGIINTSPSSFNAFFITMEIHKNKGVLLTVVGGFMTQQNFASVTPRCDIIGITPSYRVLSKIS